MMKVTTSQSFVGGFFLHFMNMPLSMCLEQESDGERKEKKTIQFKYFFPCILKVTLSSFLGRAEILFTYAIRDDDRDKIKSLENSLGKVSTFYSHLYTVAHSLGHPPQYSSSRHVVLTSCIVMNRCIFHTNMQTCAIVHPLLATCSSVWTYTRTFMDHYYHESWLLLGINHAMCSSSRKESTRSLYTIRLTKVISWF